MIYRPIAIDEEIKFSKKKFIVSKTDIKGNITFVNKNFCDVSGYSEEELIGVPHNILRHPDMPRAVFFLIWSSLLRGEPVSGVVKNLAKSGKYYWVSTHITPIKDSSGSVIGYTAARRPANREDIDEVIPKYKSMLEKER
jgi:aerotaxis receptor